jgi:sugar transferase (PEP-CTERM/EpsH1 system associated)
MNKKIKVVHLIYRLDIGGLEKVMLDSINHLPDYYEHVVICLTGVTLFAKENLQDDIDIICLNKKVGNDFSLYWKLLGLFREISPDVLHTYNLSTIEYQIIGLLAGIKKRIHAEHGWNISDTKGKNKKYNFLRRTMSLFIHKWVAVSKDINRWLIDEVCIDKSNIELVYNGVDTEHFKPVKRRTVGANGKKVIGTIGRFDPIKNQQILLDVCKQLNEIDGGIKDKINFAIVGDGPQYHNLKEKIEAEGLQDYFWLPGAKYNIAEILNDFYIFVLPSIAEGVPITLLEAMSTALPVVCSRVGGIPEVVTEDSGILVQSGDSDSLTKAILKLLNNKELAKQYGENARKRVVESFSIMSMVNRYQTLYEA